MVPVIRTVGWSMRELSQSPPRIKEGSQMSMCIRWVGTALVLALAAVALVYPCSVDAASAAEIDRGVDAASAALYARTPGAKELAEHA
jgi:hypothetical protein